MAERQEIGLKRADGRGRVVHVAATPQTVEPWASRAATTLCGQSGIWVQGDDYDLPRCAACKPASRPRREGGET